MSARHFDVHLEELILEVLPDEGQIVGHQDEVVSVSLDVLGKLPELGLSDEA